VKLSDRSLGLLSVRSHRQLDRQQTRSTEIVPATVWALGLRGRGKLRRGFSTPLGQEAALSHWAGGAMTRSDPVVAQ
jgi:hypothetical protein